MLGRKDKAKLLAEVTERFDELKSKDKRFKKLATPQAVADFLERELFHFGRGKKRKRIRERLTSWELVAQKPFGYAVVVEGQTVGSGKVSGMVRLRGSFDGGTGRFVKFVSHPFFQYGATKRAE